jgi:hypothetical protein
MVRRRRALALTLLGVSLIACHHRAKQDGEGDAAAPAASLGADAWCEQLVAAPLRTMQTQCGPADAGSAGAEAPPGRTDPGLIARQVGLQIGACTQMLARPVETRRLSLPAGAASACAAAIQADPWKESLSVRGVGWYLEHEPACQGTLVGNQALGQPCELHVECKAGLYCRTQAGVDAAADEGSCAPAPGDHAPCSRPRYGALPAEARAACGAGLYCNFETHTERADAEAISKPGADGLDPSLSRMFLDPPSRLVRAQALREVRDFGMIEPLDSGKGSPARGEGIGLGDIGSIGHGSGSGTGQGFGAGHGRLGGRTKPPQVRMGAVSVSGRLPPEVIQRIVRQNFGRFRLCYENGLRTNPALEGRVVVRFVIGRDGHVANVAGSGDLPDPAVRSCIVRAFNGLSFPEPEGGIVTVSYPIVLSPGDGSKPPTDAADAAKGPPAGDAGAEPSAATADAGGPESDTADASGATLEGGSREPKDVCLPLVGEGGSCGKSWQCADGLRCLAARCSKARFLPAGAACQDQTDCELGSYCQGTCTPRKKTGDACNVSVECQGACGRADVCVAPCGGP